MKVVWKGSGKSQKDHIRVSGNATFIKDIKIYIDIKIVGVGEGIN